MLLNSGSYYYNNRLVILKYRELNFDFNQDMLSVITIWVKFIRLPVGYWSADALSKVASAMGRPLYMNSFTANTEKISYVRVLVKFCYECNMYEHDMTECWHHRDNGRNKGTEFMNLEGRAPIEEYDGILFEPLEQEGKKEGNTVIERTGELGGGYEDSVGKYMPSQPP
ncbi:hypothetical protein HAX54_038646 [Datura stramonium]|uniref:DUF4283 domain-containing protein n=1 Tax=Datura stramonium TaxID=4076 RepID=A0ABS8VP40_DATST|nr:hypothetical protein [Datura stramonium]